MKCPHCEFDSSALVCPSCGEHSTAAALDEPSHLRHLDSMLDEWRSNSEVAQATREALAMEITIRRQRLRAASAARTAAALPAPREPSRDTPVSAPARPQPATARPRPAPAPAVPPPPVEVREPRRPRPSRPALPPPPVRLARAVVPLVSTYGLASIPYIGVLLLIGALSIGLYSVWSDIPPLIRLVIFVAATAAAYAGAHLLRVRVGLPTTATAVGLIGAALVLVDGFTLGRGLLDRHGVELWLVVSLVAAPVYATFATMIQKNLAYGFLTVGAAGNAYVAIIINVGIEPQWAAGAVTAFSGVSLATPSLVRRRAPNVAEALWWSARVALPVVMLGTLAWNRGLELFPFMEQRADDYATGLVWWLGSVTYYAAWLRTRVATLEHVAAWSVFISYVLTMFLVTPTSAWLGTTLVPFGAAYIVFGRHARSRMMAAVPVFRPAGGAAPSVGPWLPASTAADVPRGLRRCADGPGMAVADR